MQFLQNRLSERENPRYLLRELEFLSDPVPPFETLEERDLDEVVERLLDETRRRQAEGEVLLREIPELPAVMPAIPTLYDSQNQIDFRAQEDLIRHLHQQGCRGFVVMGTTGESATVTFQEHQQAVANAIRIARELSEPFNGVQIVAGAGANWTAEQRDLSRKGLDIGAQATLLLPPYYVRPQSDAELIQHFWEALDEGPGIVYRVEARSGIPIDMNRVIARLAQHPNFIGVKECDGQVRELVELFDRLDPMNEVQVWSGEEGNFLQDRSDGAIGAISVGANARWDLVSEAYRPEQSDGRVDRWMAHQAESAFEFSNPRTIHLMEAMRQAALGQITEHGFRLPISGATSEIRGQILERFSPLGISLRPIDERQITNFSTHQDHV